MGERIDLRAAVVAGLSLAALGGMLLVPPIPQDAAFHDFSDQRSFFGIPHLVNIASNLPFLLVGVAGLIHLASARSRRAFRESWEKVPYALFFGCVALVFVGSSYYHWNPTTATLFWDRLPLALLFATFLAITVIERVHARWGAALLAPLLVVAVGSLVGWRRGELSGAGDLRFYIFLQGLAMVLVPLLVLLFPPRYTRSRDFLPIALIYAVAQACAFYDGELFAVGEVVSGHTLKHLLAAVAVWRILAMLRSRRPLEEPSAVGLRPSVGSLPNPGILRLKAQG